MNFVAAGLLLLAVYAALGFDGLAHCAVAPSRRWRFTLGARTSRFFLK